MRARLVASMFVATVLLAVGISAPAGAQTPSARLDVAFEPGFPDPPVLNLLYRYVVDVGNNGGVPLDNLEIIDTLPVELTLSRVTTGSLHRPLRLRRGRGGARQLREEHRSRGLHAVGELAEHDDQYESHRSAARSGRG